METIWKYRLAALLVSVALLVFASFLHDKRPAQGAPGAVAAAAAPSP